MASAPAPPALKRTLTTRHAKLDDDGQEIVVVNGCCKWFVRFPWAVALITGLMTIVLSMLGMQPVDGLQPKNTGWTNRESLVTSPPPLASQARLASPRAPGAAGAAVVGLVRGDAVQALPQVVL